jgi:hypothetical protein
MLAATGEKEKRGRKVGHRGDLGRRWETRGEQASGRKGRGEGLRVLFF